MANKKTEGKKPTKKTAPEPERETVLTRALAALGRRVKALETETESSYEGIRKALENHETRIMALAKLEAAVSELASLTATLRVAFEEAARGARVEIVKPLGVAKNGAQLQRVRKVSSVGSSYREILRRKRAERNAPPPVMGAPQEEPEASPAGAETKEGRR
jgi:hypothetical protein